MTNEFFKFNKNKEKLIDENRYSYSYTENSNKEITTLICTEKETGNNIYDIKITNLGTKLNIIKCEYKNNIKYICESNYSILYLKFKTVEDLMKLVKSLEKKLLIELLDKDSNMYLLDRTNIKKDDLGMFEKEHIYYNEPLKYYIMGSIPVYINRIITKQTLESLIYTYYEVDNPLYVVNIKYDIKEIMNCKAECDIMTSKYTNFITGLNIMYGELDRNSKVFDKDGNIFLEEERNGVKYFLNKFTGASNNITYNCFKDYIISETPYNRIFVEEIESKDYTVILNYNNDTKLLDNYVYVDNKNNTQTYVNLNIIKGDRYSTIKTTLYYNNENNLETKEEYTHLEPIELKYKCFKYSDLQNIIDSTKFI